MGTDAQMVKETFPFTSSGSDCRHEDQAQQTQGVEPMLF